MTLVKLAARPLLHHRASPFIDGASRNTPTKLALGMLGQLKPQLAWRPLGKC